MEAVFIIAICVTSFFCIAKFIEMRYLDKETKPLKYLFRDAIIVFISILIGSTVCLHMKGTISDFFNIVTETKTLNPAATEIFTDSPGF